MDPTRLLNPKLSRKFADDRSAALRDDLLPAVKAEEGNLNGTARRLKISVDTLRRWLNKEPRLKAAFEKARIRAIKAAP